MKRRNVLNALVAPLVLGVAGCLKWKKDEPILVKDSELGDVYGTIVTVHHLDGRIHSEHIVKVGKQYTSWESFNNYISSLCIKQDPAQVQQTHSLIGEFYAGVFAGDRLNINLDPVN